MINNKLDNIDCGILNLLQKDSRVSHKQIAHKLNLSETPINVRIKRLESQGYIKRYTIIVDHKKINRGLIAFTQVQIKEHSQESLAAFQTAVIKLNEVMECHHMTGSFDFLLRIAISDMDEYHKLLTNKLSKLPDVGMMQSFFVMSEAKNDTSFFLEKEI